MDLQDKIYKIAERVDNGNLSPIEAQRELNKLEAIVKETKAIIFPALENEVSLYSKDQLKDMEVEVRNGRKNWDFKHIPEWKTEKDKLTAIETKYKSVYEATQKGVLTASEDGEELELPILKFAKDSIIIKK